MSLTTGRHWIQPKEKFDAQCDARNPRPHAVDRPDGLSNAEISIRQSLEKAKNEPHTPGADIEAARQVRQLAWLEQAAEKLR